MSLKTLIDGKGRHTRFELVKLDFDLLKRLRNAGFMKEGRQGLNSIKNKYFITLFKSHIFGASD